MQAPPRHDHTDGLRYHWATASGYCCQALTNLSEHPPQMEGRCIICHMSLSASQKLQRSTPVHDPSNPSMPQGSKLALTYGADPFMATG